VYPSFEAHQQSTEKPMNAINQVELARKLGVSRQYIQAIFSGKVPVGARMAKRLEEATCVNRLSWMYPDEYPNPFIMNGSLGTTLTGESDGKSRAESLPQLPTD
jgi:transcriptional regulator with XRE-family HTH domain